MQVFEDVMGTPTDITGGAGYSAKVCGNPGLPASDILGACIDKCEDDFSRFCVDLAQGELVSCSPDCAATNFIQTSEDCRNASIVPGPPVLSLARVELSNTSTASVAIDDESSGPVVPAGFLRYSAVSCAAPPCPFHLSEFRFTTPSFEIVDEPVSDVLVQSAGLAQGTIDAGGNFVVPVNQVKVSVNFRLGSDKGSITLANSTPLQGHVNAVTDQFTLAGQFVQEGEVKVTVDMNLQGLHTNLPPVAHAQPSGKVECTASSGAQTLLDGRTSTDPQGAADIHSYFWRVNGTTLGTGPTLPVTLPFGSSTVELDVRDHQQTADGDTQTVLVQDTTAPTVTAPSEVTAECAASTGTAVPIGVATVTDVCDASPSLQNNAPSDFPLGMTTVLWTARDDAGNEGTATQRVRIVDTTPPELQVTVTPTTLWSPNHQLVTINADISVQDICDASPTVKLLAITSNEPDNGLGDGDTPSDIQGIVLGTDDRSFQLRAERSGSGSGRHYTITYQAQDGSGNTTVREVSVTVPNALGQ
jgi:hypothetical protein